MTRRRRAAGVDDRYGLVFVLLLVSYVLSAFVGTLLGRAIALGLYLATLLVALRAAGFSRRTARGLSIVTVVPSGFVLLLVVLTPDDVAVGLVAIWTAALTVTTLCIVVARVLRHEVVSLQTVFGALSAYLLIGFLFAALYTATAQWTPQFFAGGEPSTSANMQYFSFVTLTTTGYGDLIAATSVGRTLAVMEALLGQIFLVTLVARLVSVFGTTRPVPAAPQDGPGRLVPREQRDEEGPRSGQGSSPDSPGAGRDQV